jgi:site-specific DNA-methyltransferase (adenine-specific)
MEAAVTAEFYADELVTLLHGDCVEVMATMDADSVDAIVTDPPYGLEFMGKEWDKMTPDKGWRRRVKDESDDPDKDWGVFNRTSQRSPHLYVAGTAMQEWHIRWAAEAYRVAKPGAHLLAFGGTRTYHRLTSAIEDAGWEIRDCLVWAYASGFPKSLDVSKAIDKAAGAEREVTGTVPLNAPGGSIGSTTYNNGSGRYYPEQPRSLTEPATDAAKRWQGWGTALKPAWEPIVMARKPLIGTVAANVAAHGTGALNIDATRIPSNGDKGEWPVTDRVRPPGYGMTPDAMTDNTNGRWPPNLLLTDPLFDGGVDGVVGGGTVKAGVAVNRNRPAERSTYEATGYEIRLGPSDDMGYGDTGTYSRFFLIPKAARSDREPLVRGEANGVWSDGRDKPADYPSQRGKTVRANVHPTVKPVELMRHLVRLVTPPGGTVLDCFLGSGSTAIAANMEGFRCIGIEREAEYLEISRARLAHQRIGMGL